MRDEQRHVQPGQPVRHVRTEEIRRLRAENRRLREDVAILKAATTFFTGSSTPATADRRLHRRAAFT
jgi:transposase-like protein